MVFTYSHEDPERNTHIYWTQHISKQHLEAGGGAGGQTMMGWRMILFIYELSG